MHPHFHGYFESVQQEMPQSHQEHTNLIRTFLRPSLFIYLSLTTVATSLCPLFLNFENTAKIARDNRPQGVRSRGRPKTRWKESLNAAPSP